MKAGKFKGRLLAAHLRGCAAAFRPATVSLMVASALAVMAAPASAQEARTEFDIPAQALDSSLRAFAQQSKAQVLFDEATVAGLRAPALKGSYSTGEALARLLAGSGITASLSRPGVFTLRAAARSRESTLPPVVVVNKAEWSIDRELLDRMPNKSSSIEGALALHSQVQTSNSAERSMQGGEIKPPQISISGGKPYENRYVINGLGNNNHVAPPTSSSGVASNGSTQSAYLDDIKVGSQPVGTAQSYNLDPDLLDNIELQDSRISVNHSGFTGGVVSADTRKPDPTRFGGKVRWGHNRSGWDKRFYDEAGLRGESFDESFSALRQPEYTRNTGGFMLNVPISENFAAIVAYDKTLSKIPLKYTTRSANTIDTDNATTKDQTRSAETFFTSIGGRTESGLDVNLTGVYYKYNGNYFNPRAINSEYDQEQRTYDFALNLSKVLSAGKASAKFKYGNMVSNREVESNVNKQWITYGETNWGSAIPCAVNPITGAMTICGYSAGGNTLANDLDFKQRTFQTVLDFEFNALQLGNAKHSFSVGLSNEIVKGEAVGGGSVQYQNSHAAVRGPLAPGQDGVSYDNARTGGALYDQFFRVKNVYAPYDRDAEVQTWSLWLQDTITFSDFMLRPGIRIDYDDQFRNTNFAPRVAGSWNVLGRNVAVLHAGQARYYGGPNLYYSLFKNQGSADRYIRGTTAGPDGMLPAWTKSSSGSAGADYEAKDLKTPYSDETSLGFDLQLQGGFVVNYNYVYRKGKDGIMRRFQRDGGYAATNDGESTYAGHTISISNNYFRNHFFRLSTTFADSESNYLDYTADAGSWSDITQKIDRSRVIYNGKLIDANELDLSNFNRPLQIVGLWSAALSERIHLTTTGIWTQKTDVLVNSPRVTLDDGWRVNSYTKGKLPSRFTVNMSLGIDLYRNKDQNLRATVDVYNVFNRKIQNGIGSYTVGGQPVFFDYYAPGRSVAARLEYSF
ncbi:secretin and TonB N-terminal domain-containing protein [Thauera sp.]|uniref:secretin and TonB N-terminal domain-containing protein n=1 Tax=Thauera sp. TaxID=1905334 RepID=UPI0039E60C50